MKFLAGSIFTGTRERARSDDVVFLMRGVVVDVPVFIYSEVYIAAGGE